MGSIPLSAYYTVNASPFVNRRVSRTNANAPLLTCEDRFRAFVAATSGARGASSFVSPRTPGTSEPRFQPVASLASHRLLALRSRPNCRFLPLGRLAKRTQDNRKARADYNLPHAAKRVGQRSVCGTSKWYQAMRRQLPTNRPAIATPPSGIASLTALPRPFNCLWVRDVLRKR